MCARGMQGVEFCFRCSSGNRGRGVKICGEIYWSRWRERVQGYNHKKTPPP